MTLAQAEGHSLALSGPLLSREEVEHMDQLELLEEEMLKERDGMSPEQSFRRMILSSSVAGKHYIGQAKLLVGLATGRQYLYYIIPDWIF